MANLSGVSQYYNLYNPTKGYTELLFRAGKVLQSKEMNELQSIIKRNIKNIGDSVLSDGDIIEGCQLVLKDDHKTAVITRGRIYLSGDVRDVPDTTVSITSSGTEIIGATLVSTVITADDDKTLLDVASGYDNYNQDGACRLKDAVKITVNDPTATTLFVLQDGVQLSLNTNSDLTQLDKINNTLAHRTFDESGNYKVEGLELADKNLSDAQHNYVSLGAGRAYVQGYEVIKPVAVSVQLDQATDIRYVESEPKVYNTSTATYALNNDYVKAINKLVGVVTVKQNINRSSLVDGIDTLPLTPVASIVSVKQNSETYQQGTDYKLTSDGVDWSPSGKEPHAGESYEVTWTYNKIMIADHDYQLDGNSIKFLDGDKPTEGSTFLVDYGFGLCRRDVISLDKLGNIIVTKGQSDTLSHVESPSVDSREVLPLGSVLLKPGIMVVEVINNNTQTIPMLDLYKMLNRINSLEYNQAISDLDREAADGESATQLVGVFTDGFIGVSKSDVYHSQWTASIDVDNHELVMPFNTNMISLVLDRTGEFRGGVFKRLLTAPYTEEVLAKQSDATGTMRVNSYNAFPKKPVVDISPKVDNWIDEQHITIERVTTSSVTLRRWWYHKDAAWAEEEKELWKQYGFADGGQSLGWSNGTGIRSTSSSVTTDEAIMYMRQQMVDVMVTNLVPQVDNLVVSFDGIVVKATALSSQYLGTKEGTLRANSQGIAVGHFTIPKDVMCGTREVRVYPESTPSLYGSDNYTSVGRSKVTTTTVWTRKTTTSTTDPLAQSFQLDEDRYVTGVGLFFRDKSAGEPLVVQLRNMVNGYPGTIVYAEKTMAATDVKSGTATNNETKVVFDDPVYCRGNEQYCFTILSNSDVDSVYIAETGKADLDTKEQVAKNSYMTGVMFSSSNAMTWTAHQSADLKFNLYGARFTGNGEAIFNDIRGLRLDRIMVAAEQSIPAGCAVQWRYSINGNDYLPIENYVDRDLSVLANSVKVRATLVTSDKVSPVIALDSLQLAGFITDKKSVYVSRNVPVAGGYNTVKQVIDLHLPAGTSVNMFYATDENGVNWMPMNSNTHEKVSADYDTYTFVAKLQQVAKNYRVKVELTSSSSLVKPRAQKLRSIMKTM